MTLPLRVRWRNFNVIQTGIGYQKNVKKLVLQFVPGLTYFITNLTGLIVFVVTSSMLTNRENNHDLYSLTGHGFHKSRKKSPHGKMMKTPQFLYFNATQK